MSNSSNDRERQHNHYDVLQLPSYPNRARLSKEKIKAAYHRALLIHHPDKSPNDSLRPSPGSHKSLYSIDDIVTAYEVLIDPQKRATYDQALAQDEAFGLKRAGGEKGTHIGVEVFDLEDLEYDEVKNSWSKTCRCGDKQGYLLTESDLDRESQHGEIYVGCGGCSLFIKVLFELEEE
ncbi:uncharacterized protein Z518_04914 [Rhinocladiella mackenziei CBS 650.93]|uniref:Diphthamide biosynthesis protein 4 n=1 Tax=Rhinocladiella mackenziei CBS 650.93 TaxID=1442369 RepID=A0A0D2H8Y5_9EURO|nr:uncharacterized protein Z518_04914 [Rhinocladiella mackenziei CBS 650.93]KIX06938.1 hypothetical protein Z518_04914 [Rhinocladiella mackenziei CBS 650.93]